MLCLGRREARLCGSLIGTDLVQVDLLLDEDHGEIADDDDQENREPVEYPLPLLYPTLHKIKSTPT